jgi:glutathione S-transferase
MKPRLITMPHSHFCEKARWALDLSGMEYVEEAHAPLFHWMATLKRGGRSVPVLVHDGRSYTDSTDILLHLDELGANLYPYETDLRNDVLHLEEEFDQTLGPHARRWAYAQLLPHSSLLVKAMTPNTPGVERRLLPVILPIAKPLIRESLRISDQSAVRSLSLVDQVFNQIEQKLRDGRSYLVGDRFTAADLTFASLAAPVLLPPNYRGRMPELDDVPPTMKDEVIRLRKTIAGGYALRLFDEHRQRLPAKSGEA